MKRVFVASALFSFVMLSGSLRAAVQHDDVLPLTCSFHMSSRYALEVRELLVKHPGKIQIRFKDGVSPVMLVDEGLKRSFRHVLDANLRSHGTVLRVNSARVQVSNRAIEWPQITMLGSSATIFGGTLMMSGGQPWVGIIGGVAFLGGIVQSVLPKWPRSVSLNEESSAAQWISQTAALNPKRPLLVFVEEVDQEGLLAALDQSGFSERYGDAPSTEETN